MSTCGLLLAHSCSSMAKFSSLLKVFVDNCCCRCFKRTISRVTQTYDFSLRNHYRHLSLLTSDCKNIVPEYNNLYIQSLLYNFKPFTTIPVSRSSFRCIHVSAHRQSSVAKPLISFEEGSILKNYLNKLVEKYDKIQQEITDLLESDADKDSGDSKRTRVEQLNGQLRKMDAIVTLVRQHQEHSGDIEQLNDMIRESTGKDEDFCKLARNDVLSLQEQLGNIEVEILDRLVPPSFGDQNDIILEVSAGVGGQEAMLFTKELFEMYTKYADYMGWTTDGVNFELTEMGGVRRAMACISGENVFMRMKFEGGVHRVQRVPRTERSGRVHTSTATVAVMARPTEVDIFLNMKDLRIETCRASGKGGQHVNTTDSAVRIVHLPTGMTAECQSERSQIRNKETALKVLQTRLYEKEMDAKMREHSTSRKLQVGSAGRSEKIRTYNMKDDRISDHRLGGNVYGVEGLLEGGAQLDELIDMLQAESRRERLLELIQQQN